MTNKRIDTRKLRLVNKILAEARKITEAGVGKIRFMPASGETLEVDDDESSGDFEEA